MRNVIILLLALGLASAAPLAAQSTETFDAATVGNPGVFPAGWTDGGGVFTWRVHTGSTGSLNTGPTADHTTGSGNYMYTETSQGVAGDTYILNVRPFDSSATPGPTLDFWYHMFGATMGTLVVEENLGTTASPIWTPLVLLDSGGNVLALTGDQGNQWLQAFAVLTPSTSTEIRFHYTRGTSFTGDCSIDDVTVPGTFNVLPYESNSPEAALDIDGVGTDGINPVVITTNIEVDPAGNIINNATGVLTLSSQGVVGAFYEIVTNGLALVPLGGGGIDLGGEVVNLNIAGGVGGVNGGSGILLQPMPLSGFPGAASTSVVNAFSTAAPVDVTMQGVVTDGGSPLGFRLTQGTELHIPVVIVFPPYSVCPGTAGGTLSPLSDDGSIQVSPSSAFSFYGTSYASLFVNMNGNITFGTGDSDFTPTEAEMLSDQARIAPVWDDWTPSDPQQGTVRTLDDGVVFAVEWFDVRHFGCAGVGDTNTFCATLVLGSGDILVDIGQMTLCAQSNPSTDQLTGIGPGGGLSAPNNVNLTIIGGNIAPTAADAIYEDFGQSLFGPFDLTPVPTLTSPTPSTQLLFTPTGGVGVGPYVQT